MKPRAFVMILLALAVPCMAFGQSTTPISALEVRYRKQIFKNDRLSVYLLRIPPKHASMMHRHDTDLLTVFVAGGNTRSTIYGKPPKEDTFDVGAVRFRPAGFTHSTENIGTKVFRAVILEFNSSMGAMQTAKPADSRYCDPGSETVCVDENYLFCTEKFCIQELNIAPGAVWRNAEYTNDQVLVPVSDYKLAFKQEGTAAKTLKRKNGEVEYLGSGPARQWRNAGSKPARIIAVIFR